MKKQLITETITHFQSVFEQEPVAVFLSPARINLIGEHVDYNDGFVLPAAINKYICFAISPSASDQCTFIAKDLNESYSFNWKEDLKPVDKMWVNYLLGVLQQLKERELDLKGFSIVFSSTIPMGAGLSSSAALECGFGFALNTLFKLNLSKKEIALIGQKSEHTFVGVKCGIMDQFASVFGKKKNVIKLDCTSLNYAYHQADFNNYSLLLLDSNVKHTHLTSGYNIRRQEVEKGLAILRATFPEVKSYRDCTLEQLHHIQSELGETLYKRTHFVVNEIRRVNEAVTALDENNLKKLGQLMFETHDGLAIEYEVSCPEIDFLVDFVRKEESVIGSRMMGGGFGGCSINIIEKGFEKELITRITEAYQQKFGINLTAYPVKISKGTTKVKKEKHRISLAKKH